MSDYRIWRRIPTVDHVQVPDMDSLEQPNISFELLNIEKNINYLS